MSDKELGAPSHTPINAEITPVGGAGWLHGREVRSILHVGVADPRTDLLPALLEERRSQREELSTPKAGFRA